MESPELYFCERFDISFPYGIFTWFRFISKQMVEIFFFFLVSSEPSLIIYERMEDVYFYELNLDIGFVLFSYV